MNGHEQLFDAVLDLEEQYQQEGRTAGISYAASILWWLSIHLNRAGREQGLREGRQLGVFKVPDHARQHL